MTVRIIIIAPVYIAIEYTYRMTFVELVVRPHRPASFLIRETGQGVVQLARYERRETTLADVVLRLQARA